jgi:hypothetical protein
MFFIPRYRRYPAILYAINVWGLFLVSLPFAVGAALGGQEHMVCEDEYTPATFRHSLCVW